MTSAWFLGARAPVEQSESAVRTTGDPIRTDPQNAEADAPPEWNQEKGTTDESGQLSGLSPRVEGSYTVDSEQYARPDLSLEGQPFNWEIDKQVSSSGTAAARESAGEWGHGTLQYEIGIDPLNPGEHFGNQRFDSAPLTANEGSGAYMTPAIEDQWLSAVQQATATERARQANQSTLYANYFASLDRN